MTTALWCLAFLAVWPIIPLANIGAVARAKAAGRFDNNYPRVDYANAKGLTHRAWAAQMNAWEALAMFTVAIVVTHIAGVPAESLTTLSLAFVVARVLHAAFYLADLATLRSLAFFASFGIVLWMFTLAATAA